ncbi:MAG: DUF5010 domain-containing protein [bacterium]
MNADRLKILGTFALVILIILSSKARRIYSEPEIKQTQKFVQSKIMVHYMPWFESKPFSGDWGYHWTLGSKNPEKIDEKGKREIASHFYPLIGPYDSFDPDLMEYHVLLMKLAGIDGMIVDWYGIEDYYDYALLHRNTSLAFEYANKAELEFAICYEDRTIFNMVNDNYFSTDNAVPHARQVMQFLQENWFNQSHYLKVNDRPILLNFGPIYFNSPAQWDNIFTVLQPKPYFFTLHWGMPAPQTAPYPWVYLEPGQTGGPTQEQVERFFNEFFQYVVPNREVVIGAAFPGFQDYYKEAGSGESYGYLNPRDGQTFTTSLTKSLAYNSDIIQVITWNDFGEGTNVEPAEEYGYSYLEIIQNLRREYIDTAFLFTNEELALPKQIHDFRKSYTDNQDIMTKLDEVFAHIVSGELSQAKDLLNEISTLTSVQIESGELPNKFRLSQNYPNPFNPTTTITYTIPELQNQSPVKLEITNLLGQKVHTLVNTKLRAGTYTIQWNGIDSNGLIVSSGVYIYRLVAGDLVHRKKMILMR